MKTFIKQNGKPILGLPSPIRKVALWHVTKRCNMECKYCYGTFNGSSYRKQINEKDFDLGTMLDVVEFLKKSGINRIHLCGGEPFLYGDFYELLRAIHKAGIESFVLSNLTLLPAYTEKLFSEQLINNFSFSLDSLNKEYNLSVRGAHDMVIKNIEKVLNYKKIYNSSVELGIYVVATKKNIDFLIPLINWAIEKGINYVTLQAVYLPKTHKYYNELALTRSDVEKLEKVFNYLISCQDKIRVSGSLLRFITNAIISKENLSVENCFVEHDSQYYFIDGAGHIKTCTAKKNIVGCITDGSFPCYNTYLSSSICTDFCLDCIGIWEMMYPEEVNDLILHL